MNQREKETQQKMENDQVDQSQLGNEDAQIINKLLENKKKKVMSMIEEMKRRQGIAILKKIAKEYNISIQILDENPQQTKVEEKKPIQQQPVRNIVPENQHTKKVEIPNGKKSLITKNYQEELKRRVDSSSDDDVNFVVNTEKKRKLESHDLRITKLGGQRIITKRSRLSLN